MRINRTGRTPLSFSVQLKQAMAADVHGYNFGLGALMMQSVVGYSRAGVVGAVEVGIGGLVAGGLLSGLEQAIADIPETVIRILEGGGVGSAPL